MNIDTAPDDTGRRLGRPREFEIEEALDKAIVVFSERGYHAASISELKEAIGLTAGSLYKAFRDKKAIFLAAFDRYKQVRNALLEQELVQGASGRDKVFRMLRFYAEASHGESGRRGCLVVGTATELAVYDAEAAERVGRSMARSEALFADLIREGQADGSIPESIDPATTARLLFSVTQGLRVLGKTGSDRDPTLSVVTAAMRFLA
ncbi:TetR/AcrR family transcriptional regulator [Rhizobium puerariae]|uniref:TetR/AcrR family transcriptional regulator n=1 Tax=Rhizobium puerariae TaxID=1585791 RepID=A0ABV6AQG0_9HYPH